MASNTSEGRPALDGIAARYGFPATTGRGQRIALIELSGGYIRSDLDTFFDGFDPVPVVTDHQVTARVDGLPLNGTNSPIDEDTARQILADLDRPGAQLDRIAHAWQAREHLWAKFMGTLEVSLDVQVAGALANGAAIDVFFAPFNGAGLAAAIHDAVAAHATVISISWGESESSWFDNGNGRSTINAIEKALTAARNADITVICASGDDGCRNASSDSDRGDGLGHVNYPASSPNALACGGTSLSQDDTHTAETVWNTTVLGTRRASGGGMSGLFARPDYQNGLTVPDRNGCWVASGNATDFDGRWLPDVAANADRRYGYPIRLAGRTFIADGTSAACPVWAALLARIGEKIGHNVGWINERIYKAGSGAFNDIITGDNRVPGLDLAFSAAPGWDACTGWGSPRGAALLRALDG